MATAIQEGLGIPCRSDDTIRELVRGIRTHFTKFVKPLSGGLLEQSQLGLGHSYSRSKVRHFLYCCIVDDCMLYSGGLCVCIMRDESMIKQR